ncbi:MAG: autotransporter domain-containing protein [Boseongicola sp.]
MINRIFAAGALAAASATAAQAGPSSEWEFEGRIYGWAPGVSGTTATGQDVNISFSDIIDVLDFGLMGGLEARKGHWSVLGDFQYMDISEGASAAFGPGIPVTVDADVSALIFTGAVGYDAAQTDSYRLTPFAGFRYMDLDVTANLAVGPGSTRVSKNKTNFDGIIGLQGGTQISDQWGLSYYADVGTGDSDMTWQLAAAFDYQLNETWTLSFGYRHLVWEFDDPAVLGDVAISGPIFGARIDF